MKADELLSHASAIVRERRRTYGEPAEFFEHIARRWSLVLGVPVTPAQTALCMLDVKLARLSHEPRHADSVIDLAGCSAVLWEITCHG